MDFVLIRYRYTLSRQLTQRSAIQSISIPLLKRLKNNAMPHTTKVGTRTTIRIKDTVIPCVAINRFFMDITIMNFLVSYVNRKKTVFIKEALPCLAEELLFLSVVIST